MVMPEDLQKDQEEEFKKCIKSPYYFFINYWTIFDKNGNEISKEVKSRITEEEFNAVISKAPIK